MEETASNSTLEVDEKKIIETLFNERDVYQKATEQQRSDINDIYQAYVGEISDAKDKSKSQEKITKLRTETNYIVPSVFSGNPELEVEGVGEEDADLARVAQDIVNHRINTIPQAYEKIESWVKQSVVFGTSLLSVIWRFEKKETEPGQFTVSQDEPDFQVPNILDCFYNPIIPDVENQNSIITRSVLSISEAKSNPAYNFTDKLGVLNREKIESKGNANADTYNSSRQVQNDRIDLQKASTDTIEVYERITADRIETVADGKERLLLRDIANPYGKICIVKLTHEPSAIPNRFDGYGVGHNTLGLGKLIQKLSNRLIDNVNLANTPSFMIRKSANIDKKQLVVKPGSGIEVDADGPLRDAIAQVEVADITSGGLNLLGRFDDEHKRATGANDLIQGAASNKTLGQDQIASTYSSNRFELINRRFKQALADVGRHIIEMEIKNIQSIDAPILKIFPMEAEVDAGRIKYSRGTVYQMLIAARESGELHFNIRVKGETNVSQNKDRMMEQFREWYQVFGSILPPENQLKAAKKWLELRGIDGADDLVPEPSEMMPQEQALPQPPMGQPMPNL